MKHVCIWLIRLYQKYLSPLKPTPTCRFMPTCSAYALEAFQKRGFIIGLLLTLYRVLRCNPFCYGGYDPVPEKGEKWNPVARMKQKQSESGDCDECAPSEDCGEDI